MAREQSPDGVPAALANGAASAGWYAAIIGVGILVLAIPAQLLHHVRRPERTTTEAAEIAAELEQQEQMSVVSEGTTTS